MIKFLSRSSGETQRLAEAVLGKLLRRAKGPLILALSGELGSGKTTFIQGLARALGIREKIQSPTFVLAKWYRLPKRANSFRHFIHIDCYRLEKASEVRHFNFPALLKDPETIAVIEWADRIRKFIPKKAVWIHFEHKTRNTRVIRRPHNFRL
ncbi:MAG: tRNA (adenosine(37)-N6)-threonylcarbamoyltransferase complex ATPase subunit type 1 TsaE [Candidatus Sungbacteria bacterium]|uniref:tRNA threonylcarbamoyladenosine biosynthesis protein TsaE n=1 Tax=Candidatus Sungiibacteriota bacterium TaxID=2750080 RepID=A0A933DTB5_9BACT|nr:tRNA (adenosine(37)-N6)-threonylcarbamoyltransferase complex ATPase subunit type 1 TsaE [Candidatus Sungbacteria bacterium]